MGKTLVRIVSTGLTIGGTVLFPQLAPVVAALALKEGAGLLGLGPSTPKIAAGETAIKPRRPGSTLTLDEKATV